MIWLSIKYQNQNQNNWTNKFEPGGKAFIGVFNDTLTLLVFTKVSQFLGGIFMGERQVLCGKKWEENKQET